MKYTEKSIQMNYTAGKRQQQEKWMQVNSSYSAAVAIATRYI
jgi:hypothetical protein